MILHILLYEPVFIHYKFLLGVGTVATTVNKSDTKTKVKPQLHRCATGWDPAQPPPVSRVWHHIFL
jgi:hypothetical protein